MRIIAYIKNNYKSMLREILFMFIVLVLSNAVANMGTDQMAFTHNPVRFFVIAFILSIPAGIGLGLINRYFIRKVERLKKESWPRKSKKK